MFVTLCSLSLSLHVILGGGDYSSLTHVDDLAIIGCQSEKMAWDVGLYTTVLEAFYLAWHTSILMSHQLKYIVQS